MRCLEFWVLHTWSIKTAVLKPQHQLGLTAHEVIHDIAWRGVVTAVQERGKLEGGRASLIQFESADLAHTPKLPESLSVFSQPGRVQSPYRLG